MRILLTGATGYLGSRLCRALVHSGHEVIVLKRKTSDTTSIQDLLGNLATYDLEDTGIDSLFARGAGVQAVAHLATCYGRKGERPADLIQANTQLPVGLLDAALRNGVSLFLNAASSLPRETSTYSLSKAHFEDWAQILSKGQALRFVNLKLEYFYGPGDDDSKFVTHVIRTCMRNEPDLQLTGAEQKRDFIYVDDVIAAFRTILHAYSRIEGIQEFAVGSGVAIRLRELVEMIHELTGSRTRLRFGALPYRPGEVMFSAADSSKLSVLGWKPCTAIKEGLHRTIEIERQLARYAGQ